MHEQWNEQFWERVQIMPGPDGCWEWAGSRLPSGYGRFYPAWRVGLYAHRTSWEMANDMPVPEGLFVLHKCDNPPCVRPDHLFAGTSGENVRDMHAKGRGGDYGSPGESHPNSRLTEEQVIDIRLRWAGGGVRQHELAAEFQVSRGLIGQIVRGTAWSHVKVPAAS